MVYYTLIGGVFKAIAKTKKATWKAMGSAVQSVKSAGSGFDIMGKALMFLKPITKTIGALFIVMGASIMKSVMPALQPLLETLTDPKMLAVMTDLGTIIGGVLYFVLLGFKTILEQIIDPLSGFVNWVKELLGIGAGEEPGAAGFTEEKQAVITESNISLAEEIAAAIPFLAEIPKKLTMMEREVYKPPPKPEIRINVDLRNAVVDNVDNLSRRLMERVMIELG